MLAEEKFNVKITKGFVHYLDSNQTRPVSINPFLKAQINETTDRVIETLKTYQIPGYCESKAKCRSCSLKGLCYDELMVQEMIKDFMNENVLCRTSGNASQKGLNT